MCLAAIAIAQHPRFPWVLLSNRDEFFSRRAAPLGWWTPQAGSPRVLSGRDLSAGGTWLGINEAGRLALLTNVREPGRTVASAPSRGALVTQWLTGPANGNSLQALGGPRRNGFNLLAADLSAEPNASPPLAPAWWLSNRPEALCAPLQAGIFGLSNAALDTPWPKLLHLKQRLLQALAAPADLPALVGAGMAALADRTTAAPDQLPDTGLPHDRELQLSSAFVHVPGPTPEQSYGTRCSTVVVVEHRASVRLLHVVERTFDGQASLTGEVSITHRF